MKNKGLLRHLAVAFLLAVVLYATLFYFLEHRRTAKGPWELTFTAAEGAEPRILVNQHALGITNFAIVFASKSASNVSETVVFNIAREVPFPVPFGRCVFLDGTFLPGTVTLQCFGHEIELMPRVLVLNHREHSWRGNPARLE